MIKISKIQLFFQSRYFCTVSTFPEKKDFGNFSEKQYSAVYTYFYIQKMKM